MRAGKMKETLPDVIIVHGMTCERIAFPCQGIITVDFI